MEADFYRNRLEKKYGLEVMTPHPAERAAINTIIFDELVNGQFRPESKAQFLHIIDRMIREDGIQGVILGCTEIPILIKQEDVRVPVFDTLTIHATAGVEHALSSAAGR
jgi:aspartate racemase